MKYLLYSLLLLAACQPSKNQNTTETPTARLTKQENQAWVDHNLDSVMVALTYNGSVGLAMPYRLFTPETSDRPLPLLVYLHGRGERGSDNNPKIYNNIPLFNGANSIVSPNGQLDFPCYVLVPQCSDKTINEEWAKWVGNSPETPWKGLSEDGSYVMAEHPSESAAAALELIDQVIATNNIDRSRIYLTGISMGGFGTWEFIGRRPELFAAAVPMAGYSDPRTLNDIKHIPIRIYHGDQDEYNPVAGSRTMYQLLTEAESTVSYTEYADTNHGSTFQKAWQDSSLLPWIFAQRQP